jgi:uncharacterized protein YbcI
MQGSSCQNRSNRHSPPWRNSWGILCLPYMIGDLLVVRLKGVLTVAEPQLVATLPAVKDRGLLKQVRIHLIETARPTLEAMIQEVTGVLVVSLHHDISTATGEEVVLFRLAESPPYREAKRLGLLDRTCDVVLQQ